MTSDHGEEFLEHHWVSHAQVFHHNLRVPLIVLHPDVAPRRVGPLARLVDLVPTLIDVAGLDPSGPTAGRSLVPFLVGAEADSVATPQSFAQASVGGGESIYLDDAEGDRLYQYVKTPFRGHWVTPRGAVFETTEATLRFGALAYLEPRRLLVEVDGVPREPILVDRIARRDEHESRQPVEIALPGDGAKHVVRLSAESCAPAAAPGSPDCRCLAFNLDGLPEARHALYEVRSDPNALRDVSDAEPRVVESLVDGLEEANRDFRAVAESETRELSPEVVERLKALGYL